MRAKFLRVYFSVILSACIFSFFSFENLNTFVCSEPETDTAFSSWPKALLLIEDGAFENTALESVQLPASLVEIGERAFSDIESLYVMHVSSRTEKIGNSFLDGSPNAMIAGSINSYAGKWAKQNKVPFSPIAMMLEKRCRKEEADLQSFVIKLDEFRRPGSIISIKEFQAERRTGRSTGDLKASHFKGVAAQHIQSRFFP